ncbi:MAG: FAD-dependent thymidylate synthase [Clostridia bacterium]|nr:FAD-dependent thymidylate synthase [Clostridia bacterium]
MKINVIASTKVGYEMSKEEALNFSGKSAGICYLPDTLETLFNEPIEKTEKRANMTLKSGHHSVFNHPVYNLSFEGIPKILAMILNNEKMYNTSEKSARYTKMEPSEAEKVLYEKWIDIYREKIAAAYPKIEEKRVQKLAQENARYLISVFTPATVMEYTVNFGQLNYIVHFFENFINDETKTSKFDMKLKEVFKEFLKELPDLKVDGLDADTKKRSLSFFATRKNRQEEFGENYSTTYLATFAELAQAQRHRTLNYEVTLLDEAKFYVPPIIRGTELEEEWLKDISSLEEYYPQGMLLKINERGTVENFVLKCTERICGAAQLEIMEQTIDTMNKYLEATKETNEEVYNYLLPYSKGARCTFPGFRCTQPCVFGGPGAVTRKI